MSDSVTFEVDVSDVESGIADVQAAAEDLSDITAVWADELVGEYRAHIDAGANKSGGFPAPNAKYAERKAREGFGSRRGIRSGEWYGSIEPRHDTDSASAGSTLDYPWMNPGMRPQWISEATADKFVEDVGDRIEGAWLGTSKGTLGI